MDVIRPFDPWKSKLCTCPQKYSFNPYTGCQYNCLYCYSTYIPNFKNLRIKKNLFKRVVKDLEKIPKNALISMSNSSDPYPIVEKKYGITRKCLEIFKECNIRLLVVTKGDVTRDIDLLSNLKSAVSITITCDTKIAKILEPNAPEPSIRIEVIKKLKDAGIPTILRLDPIIPFVNENALWIIEKCEPDHVVTSTLKLRWDSFKRIISAFPFLEKKYRELYIKNGEKIQNYFYLPKNYRIKLLSKVKEKCEELGLSYAFCREGINFKAKSCDGSHLIN